jgi:hypothetical protein
MYQIVKLPLAESQSLANQAIGAQMEDLPLFDYFEPPFELSLESLQSDSSHTVTPRSSQTEFQVNDVPMPRPNNAFDDCDQNLETNTHFSFLPAVGYPRGLPGWNPDSDSRVIDIECQEASHTGFKDQPGCNLIQESEPHNANTAGFHQSWGPPYHPHWTSRPQWDLDHVPNWMLSCMKAHHEIRQPDESVLPESRIPFSNGLVE